MILVERSNELAILHELFSECLQRKGNIAWISGPAAIGKSALLQEFTEEISSRGDALILKAACTRIEHGFSFGLIRRLIQADGVTEVSADQAARLLDKALMAKIQLEESTSSFLPGIGDVFDDLCQLLLDAAAAMPVVICVDDAQYADGVSLRFLLYLAQHVQYDRVLIVVTEGTEAPPIESWLVTDLLRQPNCRHIQLAPLSTAGVAALLAGRSNFKASATELAPRVQALTGGNPRLVQALAEDMTENSCLSTPGNAFSRAVLSVLYRCDPVAIETAQALAILNEPADATILGEMLSRTTEFTKRALDILSTVGILNNRLFRHKSIRHAVLNAMSAEDHATMHMRAAYVLRTRQRPARAMANHIVETERMSDLWAVSILCEAAEDSLMDGDVPAAIKYLHHAYQDCDDESIRPAILADLVRVIWRIDPANTVSHLPNLLSALHSGNLKGRQAVILVNLLLWQGRVREAVEILRSHQSLLSEPCTAAETLRWATGFLPELDDFLSSDKANAKFRLSGIHMRGEIYGEGAEFPDTTEYTLTERVLQESHLNESTIGPVFSALISLIGGEQLARAEQWCQALQAGKERYQDSPTWEALLLAVHAMVRIRGGDPAGAAALASRAMDLLPAKSWGIVIGLPFASLLLAYIETGRYQDATALLRIQVPESVTGTPFGPLYLHARGRYYLATGRPHAALQDFSICERLAASLQFDVPMLVPWRVDMAWARLKIGDRKKAEKLLNEELSRLADHQVITRGLCTHALALASPIAEQPDLLREAMEMLSGNRLAQAQVLTDLGYALNELGDRRHAGILVRKATNLALSCGGLPRSPSMAESPEFMADTGSAFLTKDGDVADLSDAERRVATLAAQGYTNQQISRQLYVTVSTVEQHLTRVYRKLKVRRRSDLQLGTRSTR
jgi:DNA-binding CsgD family transcriptional regulator